MTHGALFYVARSRVSWQCSRRVLAMALLRSIVARILPPWAIGHECRLCRNVATMGASFVHDTIISIVVSAAGKVFVLRHCLIALLVSPLVTWTKATICQTVPKRVVTHGTFASHRGLRGAFEAFRRCPPEHICLGGESGVRGVRGASAGIICVLSLSPICGSRTCFPQGRGVKLDSDYSGSAPWSKFFCSLFLLARFTLIFRWIRCFTTHPLFIGLRCGSSCFEFCDSYCLYSCRL